MCFRIKQVAQFLYMTLLTLASMFWRQRHKIHVNEILARVKLNNSEKECDCSS